eukprot:6126249-Lingulodinium_polyedra.AAC.1
MALTSGAGLRPDGAGRPGARRPALKRGQRPGRRKPWPPCAMLRSARRRKGGTKTAAHARDGRR